MKDKHLPATGHLGSGRAEVRSCYRYTLTTVVNEMICDYTSAWLLPAAALLHPALGWSASSGYAVNSKPRAKRAPVSAEQGEPNKALE